MIITEYSIPPSQNDTYVVDSITAGPDGNLWFVVCQGNVIDKISPDTGAIIEYPILSLDFGNILNEIIEGPDGNLWFTFGGGYQIGKISPSTGTVTDYQVGY